MTLTDKQIEQLSRDLYLDSFQGALAYTVVRDWLKEVVEQAIREPVGDLPAFLKQQAE